MCCTKVNPVFFLLPLLELSPATFSALPQYLAMDSIAASISSRRTRYAAEDPSLLDQLSPETPVGQGLQFLARLRGATAAVEMCCDTKVLDEQGLQTTLYRLNREKALEYLATKTEAVAEVLQQQTRQTQERLRVAHGSFAPTSAAIGGGPAAGDEGKSSKKWDQTSLEYALQIMSEYLQDHWILQLCLRFKYVACAVFSCRCAFSAVSYQLGAGLLSHVLNLLQCCV
jgi:hypothetical protein